MPINNEEEKQIENMSLEKENQNQAENDSMKVEIEHRIKARKNYDDGEVPRVVPRRKEEIDARVYSYQNLKDMWNQIKDDIKKPLGFLSSDVTRAHRGIYAIIKKEGKVLVIKKARGPYTGLYDLPGGSPEGNETPEETVIREVKEETNCDVQSFSNKREETILFSDFTKESGEVGCMQHTGVLFDVEVSGTPTTSGDGLDSNGAVWVDIDSLSPKNATPFVLMGIKYQSSAYSYDITNSEMPVLVTNDIFNI